jgi:hypothetical protein
MDQRGKWGIAGGETTPCIRDIIAQRQMNIRSRMVEFETQKNTG